MSPNKRLSHRFTKPASSCTSSLTRSASSMRAKWHTSALRTKRASTSSTWDTSLRTVKLLLTSSSLVSTSAALIETCRPQLPSTVTDPNGRILRAGITTPVITTATEFAAHFDSHQLGEQNRADIAAYRNEFVGKPHRQSAYMESARAERSKRARQASPYTISIPMQAAAVVVRRVQVLRGNIAATVILSGCVRHGPFGLASLTIKFRSFIFQAVVVGTVFLKLKERTDAYFSRGGVLFL